MAATIPIQWAKIKLKRLNILLYWCTLTCRSPLHLPTIQTIPFMSTYFCPYFLAHLINTVLSRHFQYPRPLHPSVFLSISYHWHNPVIISNLGITHSNPLMLFKTPTPLPTSGGAQGESKLDTTKYTQEKVGLEFSSFVVILLLILLLFACFTGFEKKCFSPERQS